MATKKVAPLASNQGNHRIHLLLHGEPSNGGGGGGIRLIVGFQPLMVISPTASWIRWCMQVYAVVS